MVIDFENVHWKRWWEYSPRFPCHATPPRRSQQHHLSRPLSQQQSFSLQPCCMNCHSEVHTVHTCSMRLSCRSEISNQLVPEEIDCSHCEHLGMQSTWRKDSSSHHAPWSPWRRCLRIELWSTRPMRCIPACPHQVWANFDDPPKCKSNPISPDLVCHRNFSNNQNIHDSIQYLSYPLDEGKYPLYFCPKCHLPIM